MRAPRFAVLGRYITTRSLVRPLAETLGTKCSSNIACVLPSCRPLLLNMRAGGLVERDIWSVWWLYGKLHLQPDHLQLASRLVHEIVIKALLQMCVIYRSTWSARISSERHVIVLHPVRGKYITTPKACCSSTMWVHRRKLIKRFARLQGLLLLK